MQVDFEALFAEHAPWLIEVARSVTRSRTDAEDVVQEAFLRAYRSRERFRGDGDARHWLKRIVVHAAIDVLRQRPGQHGRPVLDHGAGPDAVAAAEPGPLSLASDGERAEAVRRAVDQLPEHQRTVLLLREFGGLGYREIAEQLGLPRGTVESRVIRGREKLRELLAEHLEGDRRGGVEEAVRAEE